MPHSTGKKNYTKQEQKQVKKEMKSENFASTKARTVKMAMKK